MVLIYTKLGGDLMIWGLVYGKEKEEKNSDVNPRKSICRPIVFVYLHFPVFVMIAFFV